MKNTARCWNIIVEEIGYIRSNQLVAQNLMGGQGLASLPVRLEAF